MKRILVFATLLVICFSVISCAPAATPAPSKAPIGGFSAPGAPPMPAATAAPAATSAPVPRSAQDKSGAVGESGNSIPSVASADRMIVYNVQLNVEVQDTEKAANDISAIVSQFKGYIAATNMTRTPKGQMMGTITLRVPAESLDAAQKAIEGVGLKVLSRNRNSNDVTDQYTDLNARLTNLQATEDELRKLLDTVRERTGKAEDILAVYNRLTEIRGQIEQIKGQMNVLSKTSSFATLTVSLTPHEEIQVLEPESWLPNRTAAQALRSLVQALQGLADLGIWGLLFFLPVIIVLLLPLLIIGLVVRSIMQRRNKKKAIATT
ncbi:MAG TPA: DUF4349 domain-containing protein [Anaerolineae bacterium]